MSANLTLKHHTGIFRRRPCPLVSLALLVIATLIVGCASQTNNSLLLEVENRHPPKVQLGSELILLENPPELCTSIIDLDGVVHLFIIDEDKQLIHLEILGDEIIHRELLGVIETIEPWSALDAVEHPRGKLRVIAGDRQYFRSAPDLNWQEIKGNRCTRFVPVNDDLFCAFVIKGEEVAAPERTDYVVGWFLLVPVFYWSHEHAAKIVLAQESQDGWIVRAVVDPDTPLDAHGDFLVGTDRLGNIHFLYFSSEGGGAFFLFAYGYGGGGGMTGSAPIFRYAHLTIDQLLNQSADPRNQPSINRATPIKWMAIKGAFLPHIPFIKKDAGYKNAIISLQPLNRNFSVNKVTGEVSGLIQADNSWLEIRLNGLQWLSHYNVVTTKSFPTPKSEWLDIDGPLIKIDGRGGYHLLIESAERGFWTSRSYMNYIFKNAEGWFAPIDLGSRYWYRHRKVVSLATSDSGAAFATWLNEERQFIGRWIRPRRIDVE